MPCTPFAIRLVSALAAAVLGAPAQAGPTLTFGNSPGGYPGSLVYAGGATALSTGVPIDVFGPSLSSLSFAMTTAATPASSWTFPAGGSVTMTNNNAASVLFTGVLGVTTVQLSPEEPGSFTGFKWAVRGTFTVTDLDDGYEASLGLASDTVYDGDFWFGFNEPTATNGIDSIPMVVGEAFNRPIGWRQIHLVARDPQTPAARLPEPPVWGLVALASWGLLLRRRAAVRE